MEEVERCKHAYDYENGEDSHDCKLWPGKYCGEETADHCWGYAVDEKIVNGDKLAEFRSKMGKDLKVLAIKYGVDIIATHHPINLETRVMAAVIVENSIITENRYGGNEYVYKDKNKCK